MNWKLFLLSKNIQMILVFCYEFVCCMLVKIHMPTINTNSLKIVQCLLKVNSIAYVH